jgi:nucleoside phosphorylase
VHCGTTASGNQAIEHALVRDKLGLEHKALWCEMVVAGLMKNFPCIVIRGICDYSDSHKNKRWQPFAALSAAAYTKELLSFDIPSQVADTRKASQILASSQFTMEPSFGSL